MGTTDYTSREPASRNSQPRGRWEPSRRKPSRVDADWTLRDEEAAVLHKNVLPTPYVGPVDFSMLYLCVCVWACVDG